MNVEAGPAFDSLAERYDQDFGHGVLGSLLRKAVWRRLEACFREGQQVLDLGCGTGEDAVWLARRGIRVLGIDASGEMLAVARAKVRKLGLEGLVQLDEAKIEELDGVDGGQLYDGALSNFGALNCVEDLAGVAKDLAARLRPGALAVLCLMGPLVPWEWIWYSLRGEYRKAFRRLRPGGVPWRGVQVRYPSIRSVARVFGPQFQRRSATAIGALIPPTYAEAWAARRPRTLTFLERWERRLEGTRPLAWLADHYLLELERTREP